MSCPYLTKKNVKYCGLCRLAMIPLDEAGLSSEQCSGPGYRDCALLKERHEGPLPEERCPHLCVGEVYSCEAAPLSKMIPCNQATSSRCSDDRHKYCQLYLAATEAAASVPDDDTSIFDDGTEDDPRIVPPHLAFAPNHMWVDRGDERACHVGVDAFFARVLGRVDDVVFRRHSGSRQPVVTFRVDGVDLDMVFPLALQDLEVNAHLSGEPSAVVDDPYGRGWLFAGRAMPVGRPGSQPVPEQDFRRGEEAASWLERECDRLVGFVGGVPTAHDAVCGPLLQDGGGLPGHLAGVLDHADLVRLHSEFFTLNARRTELC